MDGLPDDVFEDEYKDLSLATSMKFLRVASPHPDLFKDVAVVRRGGRQRKNSNSYSSSALSIHSDPKDKASGRPRPRTSSSLFSFDFQSYSRGLVKR